MTPHDLTNGEPAPDMEHEPSSPSAGSAESPTPAHVPPVSKSAALTYISKKLDPQHVWYDQKATRSKRFHYSLLSTSMIATASIVVANSFHFPALSTALAVIATLATGFSGMVKFQEHWIRYRSASTALEGLKLRYEIGMHPFEGPGRHGLLIEEAEKVFVQEQSQWTTKSSENVRPPANPTYPA